MHTLKTYFILFLLVLGAALPTRADGPALWSFGDEDTRIFLFGTIHFLEPDQSWLTDTIKSTFVQSDTLMLELDMQNLVMVGQELQAAATLDEGQNLEQLLGAGLYSDVERIARQAGLPRSQYFDKRPWFAALMTSVELAKKSGFDPRHGADVLFLVGAQQMGKPILGLEKSQTQVSVFKNLTSEEERTFLLQALQQSGSIKEDLLHLQNAWKSGDLATLANVINKGFAETPDLSKRILDDRNRDWAGKLKAQLDLPGTIFVAVGAGHLVGPNSVQNLLQTEGIAVSRIN